MSTCRCCNAPALHVNCQNNNLANSRLRHTHAPSCTHIMPPSPNPLPVKSPTLTSTRCCKACLAHWRYGCDLSEVWPCHPPPPYPIRAPSYAYILCLPPPSSYLHTPFPFHQVLQGTSATRVIAKHCIWTHRHSPSLTHRHLLAPTFCVPPFLLSLRFSHLPPGAARHWCHACDCQQAGA